MTDDADRVEVTVRVPRMLLAQIDRHASLTAAEDARPNRNATICALIRRGLRDAMRTR
jgi:hypothetical protein